MTSPSFSNVKEVFEQWSMYNAVVQADYMSHTELTAKLADWAREQPAPLRIVDLGCGDAWVATTAFRDANVASYCGVDVSDSAAELAREHIAIWPGCAQVTQGNLADYLQELPADSANVILASYSLHHYLSDAKTAIIADCYRVLVPGGTLFWIDPVCRAGETRDAYVVRLTEVMRRDWTALTPEQRDKACTHVLTSDFPETADWMVSHVETAGFLPPTSILYNEFFGGWKSMKPKG
jgi:ubiquinone/menaquinone biosynthesis C-methylase UbiE